MRINNNFKAVKYIFITLLVALFFNNCGSVPITGRRQLQLVSDEEILALSLKQYQEYMSTAKVVHNTANANMVTRVGQRIATATENYLKNNGYESQLKNFAWEFNLVSDKSVNAFAMPGGKIVVYEGLLPITQSEEALAVVIGHEVAHVVAKHAAERMSQAMALQYGGAITSSILGANAGSQVGQAVFGLGAQYGVMMPYARKQEHEADELGLVFMAMAGYNPQTAVQFWKRMMQASGGSSTPEFLSTHPADAKRIEYIELVMPAVMQFYKGSGVQNTESPKPTSTQNNKPKTSEDWTF